MALYGTLHENKDFRRAYKSGKSCVSPALVVYVCKNRAGFCRLGITAGKKLGGAVQRNRAKRVIRAAFYDVYKHRLQNSPALQNRGVDIVIVARYKATQLKSTRLQPMLTDCFQKTGLLAKNSRIKTAGSKT